MSDRPGPPFDHPPQGRPGAIEKISREERDVASRTNIPAMSCLTKTASIHPDSSSPQLLAYAADWGAIRSVTGGPSRLLAERPVMFPARRSQ